jgi:plasmid stabilization system protein ParE
MIMEVLFAPSARVQFVSAVQTIRRKNPTAGRKFRTRAEKSLKRLERFPQSGTVIAEFPELPYREVYVKPYRFFYRIRESSVWIVAVWHGAQVPDDPTG